MRVKILEIELTRPLPEFSPENLAGYTHLQALIRRYNVPLVYIFLETGTLTEPGRLQKEIDKACNEAQETHKKESWSEEERPEPTEWPSVSVVVCTRNRPESLRRCLESLAKLDYPDLEILIIDNAPQDNVTCEVVKEFSTRNWLLQPTRGGAEPGTRNSEPGTQNSFRYVVEPRPGLDWARNRGILESRGEIIAYTDDDVRIDPGWVRALAQNFVREEVMAVTGLVAPAERETEAQHLFEKYGGFGRGFHRRYFSQARQKHWYYFPLNASIFGTGCNMAFRRSFFERHGCFDEALDVGTPTHGAGDLDMFYRVVRAGYTIVYEPEALVWHYHRREYQKLCDQLHDFGRGYFSYLTKCFISDPSMRQTVLRWTLDWSKRWFWRRLRYRPAIGRKLVLIELAGALEGPFAYFIARRQAHKIKQHYGELQKLL